MNEIADKYAAQDIGSVFIYTHEAHPGENYRHHGSMDDKRHHAHAFQTEFNVRRPMLLDDLEGTVHRAYGTLPNMTWIIGPGGLIHYKAAWTDPSDIEDTLRYSLDALERRVKDRLLPYHSERLKWRGRDDAKFRERLKKNGPQAVTDFYSSFP